MTRNAIKIPDGWCVKKLGDCADIISGGTPDTENAEYWNGSILWLTPSEVTKLSSKYASDTERKITEKGLKNSSAVLLPEKSLIVCTRATVGDCCINVKPMTTNQGFKNLIFNKNSVEFFYYLLSNSKKELLRKACGSTFLEISKKDVERLKILVPPLAEQEKIADILGCWDSAIEKLTALIDAKKQRKKSLMQNLLTAKIRLPGFTDEWKRKQLQEIASISKGEQLGRLEMTENGRYPVMNGGVSSSGRTNDFNRNENSITISEGGNSCGFVSLLTEKFWCGGHCYTLADLRTNTVFLFQMLKFYEEDIMRLRVGSGLPNIQKPSLGKVSLGIPPLPEQQAIADILSKADEEIDLLIKKLSLIQEQKKGLMQKLLTGQIRVKVA